MANLGYQKPQKQKINRRTIRDIILAILITGVIIGAARIQDSIVYTSEGMKYIPAAGALESDQGEDALSTQTTLPHATTAIAGAGQVIEFAPQIDPEVNAEKAELPPDVPTRGRIGRVLTFGQYALQDFSSAAHLLKAAGDELVVMEMKSPAGKLAYRSSFSAAERARANGSQAEDYYVRDAVQSLHKEKIKAAARISCFADSRLADAEEEMVLVDTAGIPCSNYEGFVLLDPANSELRNYLLTVVEETLSMGFDMVILEDFGYPAAVGTDGESLKSLFSAIKSLMGDRTLGLMIYPESQYVQDAEVVEAADSLWTSRQISGAHYRVDSTGMIFEAGRNS